MLEILIALAVMGVTAVIFLAGLATASRASAKADERTTAESLARSQTEYVKTLPYQTDANQYAVDPGLVIPESWTVLPAAVTALHNPDDGIQQMTITVQRNGATVLTINTYKVDR